LDGQEEQRDLVVVALPGVQRFIAEARSTSDVSAASEIYSTLAARIVDVLGNSHGGTLVLPAGPTQAAEEATSTSSAPPSSGAGMPNRVVALLPAGTGAAAAARASRAAHESWQALLRQALEPAAGRPLPETPGFPRVQWVCVPSDPAGYRVQWQQAQRLLAARRRVRDFAAVPEEEWRRRKLCSLTPRWPAEPEAPRGAPRHEKGTQLSAVGWVKRLWRPMRNQDGFPSTPSIASAPYRRAVLEHLGTPEVSEAVGNLARAEARIRSSLRTRGRETPVPGLPGPDRDPGRWLARSGGPWVYPERWRAEALAREAAEDRAEQAELAREIRGAADAGHQAARRLREVMDDLRRRTPPAGPPIPALTSYLAVVVQDLDSMGRFLGGGAPDATGRKIQVNPNDHRRVSQDLLRAARAQRDVLETTAVLGVPVYAGGDDLLAFTPASTALAAAEACHREIPSSLPRASTAVLFFHYHASIQQAMSHARSLLDEAKDRVRGKHALAVGYLRRSGVSAVSIQPWDARGGSSAALFGLFAREREPRLSPRLVADLERDAGELGVVAGQVRGPVLARRDRDGWTPYFPVPADLVVTADRAERRVFRLRPEDSAGRTDLGDADAAVPGGALRWLMPPADAEPVEPLQGWIPGDVLAAYLAGDLPDPDGSPLEDLDPLMRGDELARPFVPEVRVGLAREGRSVRAGATAPPPRRGPARRPPPSARHRRTGRPAALRRGLRAACRSR
jgi:hypothetical protein